jgi:hypothetical protein
MTDNEHEQAVQKTARYWEEKLKKSEDKVFFWKMTAIVGISLLLWSVLELRGCLPHDRSQQGWPAVEP